jgi:hypothetical protein
VAPAGWREDATTPHGTLAVCKAAVGDDDSKAGRNAIVIRSRFRKYPIDFSRENRMLSPAVIQNRDQQADAYERREWQARMVWAG